MSLNVEIGNRVEITLNNDDSKKKYISVVENVYKNNLILMHMPISYGTVVKLPTDSEYKMMFYTDKGIYKYTARIIKFFKEGNFNFMAVELCSNAEKFQRREFFRYECIIDFKFDKLLENETAILFDSDLILSNGIIKDLSAGGIRFVSNEEVSANDIIKCIIPLNSENLVCAAKVIHRQYFPKSLYKFQYRTEFIEFKESYRDQIIRFIFEEQRKLAKRS